MKFEIKNRFTGNVIFTCELDTNFENMSFSLQLGVAVKRAYAEGAYLEGADLEGADLRGADLKGADLEGAYLEGADLRGADLKGADLEGAYLKGAYLEGADLEGADLKGADLKGADLKGADLEGADLEGADLEPIKNDFFVVLLQAIPEIPFLEKSMLEGKIDGSTYEGGCACLCGTIEKSGRFGESCNMRDAGRPIERFFLGIKPGDTPTNSQFSKIAFEWLQEFKSYLNIKAEQGESNG